MQFTAMYDTASTCAIKQRTVDLLNNSPITQHLSSREPRWHTSINISYYRWQPGHTHTRRPWIVRHIVAAFDHALSYGQQQEAIEGVHIVGLYVWRSNRLFLLYGRKHSSAVVDESDLKGAVLGHTKNCFLAFLLLWIDDLIIYSASPFKLSIRCFAY